MEVKLLIDDKKIELNSFVKEILSGTIIGAVSSLREIKKDWKKIEIQLAS